MRKYRTLEKMTEAYFQQHPEEIEDFLNEIFSAYAKDRDSSALLSELRVIARVKGFTLGKFQKRDGIFSRG